MITQSIIDTIHPNPAAEDSYYTADDGLKYCKVCNAPKEVILKVKGVTGKYRCICKCEEAELDRSKRADVMRQIAINRSVCFRGSTYSKALFSTSEPDERLNMAENYVKSFSEMRKRGKGLLLYGNVGTGKSHIAACICNALIDEGYLCKMTSLSTIASEARGYPGQSVSYTDLLRKYDLIVFDDLGIERDTEYMTEQVFQIIDNRVSSGLPMIVTTNLTMAELSQCDRMEQRRVYQRVLEHCHPLEAKGGSRRMQKAASDYEEMERLLRGGGNA